TSCFSRGIQRRLDGEDHLGHRTSPIQCPHATSVLAYIYLEIPIAPPANVEGSHSSGPHPNTVHPAGESPACSATPSSVTCPVINPGSRGIRAVSSDGTSGLVSGL